MHLFAIIGKTRLERVARRPRVVCARTLRGVAHAFACAGGGCMRWERYKTAVVYRFMTFAHLVDEIRQLPVEEKVELRHVLDEELSEAIRSEVLAAHTEALQEYKDGKLTFTSDAQELLRSLDGE